ncbi:hypothetical protein HQ487_04890 [Candidatus Uhrbacteria bacterium]|nr:hypothetical protein [Candidatus Uhrbacteria bacterium]
MNESVGIIFIAFAGFLLAVYLHHKKKRKNEPFICPLRGNCTEVMHSDYSKFLGIPVEVLGMVYYALLAVGHGLSLVNIGEGWIDALLLLVSSSAFLFSLYLTSVQVFTLKKLCTWCLLSALFCLSIFTLSLISFTDIVVPLLFHYQSVLDGLHLFAVGLGTGIATTTTVFFYQFLRDGRISEDESRILSVLFELGWVSLGLLLIFSWSMFLSDPLWLLHISVFTGEFLASLGVILGTGFLTLKVIPKLYLISSGQDHVHRDGEVLLARKRIFMVGPVSLVSWYLTFLLSLFPDTFSIPFEFILIGYLSILLFSATLGYLIYSRLILPRNA